MVDVECRRAGIGCVDCKKLLARNMNAALAAVPASGGSSSTRTPNRCGTCCTTGQAARASWPRQTMSEVRAAIGLPMVGIVSRASRAVTTCDP